MRLNKRGQELSVNTLILIIIGVLILVFLIIGFSIGWKKIFPFITPGNNVKEVVDKCSLACNTGSQYDFCTAKRDIRVDDSLSEFGGKKEATASCYELKNVVALGIDTCQSIQCKNVVFSSEVLAKLSCGQGEAVTLADVSETDAANDQKAFRYLDAQGQISSYKKCPGPASTQ